MTRVPLTAFGLLVALTGCHAGLQALNVRRSDTGISDTGTNDTGILDSGSQDTGVQDTGTTDTGIQDTGTTDTGTTDTGTTDTGTTDTGTTDTGTQNQAPSLDSFTVSSTPTDLVVSFSASDPDGDLSGGQVELSVDGTVSSYLVPDDLSSWDGSSGTVQIAVAGIDSCDATTYTVSGTVRDAGGLLSGSLDGQATISSDGDIQIQEIGDDGTAQDIGIVNPPVTLCGNIWGASNDGTTYTSDYDSLLLTVGGQGKWDFSLTWATLGDDYDMYLWDAKDSSAPVAYSATPGTTQPETFNWSVHRNDQYYLDVGAWSGVGGTYAITIVAQ